MRTLRHERLRPELAAGPAAGRGRRAARHGLLARPQRPRRLHQQRQEGQRRRAGWDTHGTKVGKTPNFPVLRETLLPALDVVVGAVGRPGPAARPGANAGGLDGRVRPVAADQRRRGPRPLRQRLFGDAGRRRRPRRPGLPARRTATAPFRRTTRCAGDFAATLYHCLGLPPTRRSPTASAGRCGSLCEGRPIRALF